MIFYNKLGSEVIKILSYRQKKLTSLYYMLQDSILTKHYITILNMIIYKRNYPCLFLYTYSIIYSFYMDYRYTNIELLDFYF